MSKRRSLRSISIPITLGAVTVVLSAALLVGWSILLANNIAKSEDVSIDVWLLVLGAISFMVIITVLVLFSIFLAREILEVRRQDSFIDSVTHELRSPLASLKLCLETMEREDLPEDRREHLHSMMVDDVDRLSSFIDDVLQASRLAHEQPAMSTAEFSLRDVALVAARTVASRHHLDEGVITIDVPASIELATDRAALEIVLRNLIDNAIKYSGSEPHVEVRARPSGPSGVIVEVEDRGIGIDRGQLERVFQRFYRVEEEEVRKRRGTGLGLFVVKQLVRNLGGHIEALSGGRGSGTTMRVRLPGAVMRGEISENRR
jgi:signal transduction histidine kinase